MESSIPDPLPSREQLLAGLKQTMERVNYSAAKAEAVKAKRAELRAKYQDIEVFFAFQDKFDELFKAHPDIESPEIKAHLQEMEQYEQKHKERIEEFQTEMRAYIDTLKEPENPSHN